MLNIFATNLFTPNLNMVNHKFLFCKAATENIAGMGLGTEQFPKGLISPKPFCHQNFAVFISATLFARICNIQSNSNCLCSVKQHKVLPHQGICVHA